MELSMRRVVLFTRDMPRLVRFYRDVLGLEVLTEAPGWVEFDARGCRIALHNGPSRVGARPPKIGFWAADIGQARETLLARGVAMSELLSGGGVLRAEGKDPDGNPFSVSNRA